jgi:hypothetical protein
MDQRMIVVAKALVDVALCECAGLGLDTRRPAQEPRLDLPLKTKTEVIAHAAHCTTARHTGDEQSSLR